MTIGLKQGTVELVAYNPEWITLFEAEKKLLLEKFSDVFLAVEHIGSTAIPGMPAKPIIDMLAGVSDLAIIPALDARFREIDYTLRENGSTEDQILYVKGPAEKRTHYLHLPVFNSPSWQNTMRFQKRLLENPVLAEEYLKLKKGLALKFPDDRGSYTKAKREFTKRVMELQDELS